MGSSRFVTIVFLESEMGRMIEVRGRWVGLWSGSYACGNGFKENGGYSVL